MSLAILLLLTALQSGSARGAVRTQPSPGVANGTGGPTTIELRPPTAGATANPEEQRLLASQMPVAEGFSLVVAALDHEDASAQAAAVSPLPTPIAVPTTEGAEASGTPPPEKPVGDPNPAALLKAVQTRYEALGSARYEFTQRYLSRATGRTQVESGVLLVAKPGKMRWEYRSPETKLFVVQGSTAWLYVPAEEIAYRMHAGEADAHRIPARFLAGQGRLDRDYVASPEPSGPQVVRLVPRESGEDYDYLLLELAEAGGAVRKLSVIDALGNVTSFEFTTEELNPKVRDQDFEFRPPRGVEVVEAAEPGKRPE